MTAASRRSASPLPTLATWALWLLGALLLVFVVAVPMDVTQQLVFSGVLFAVALAVRNGGWQRSSIVLQAWRRAAQQAASAWRLRREQRATGQRERRRLSGLCAQLRASACNRRWNKRSNGVCAGRSAGCTPRGAGSSN
ncbi:putative cellulose synthase catalytic subunit [Xanthomonas citri pv. fuscans]|nr:putative cellulose synthase catalytic subunit [Xanthomonas citri pv. fuscans]